MATVTTPTRVYQVKNLGWLLRRTFQIDAITIEKRPQGRAHMTVICRGNNWLTDIVSRFNYPPWTYSTYWASFKLCVEWCKRPALRGIDVRIIGEGE